MRYMMMIKHSEDYRNKEIPQALMDAMGEFVDENTNRQRHKLGRINRPKAVRRSTTKQKAIITLERLKQKQKLKLPKQPHCLAK